jgi:catechol 1,2-dioxygenase
MSQRASAVSAISASTTRGVTLLWAPGLVTCKASLAPTEANILGPYHREGAPFVTNLARPGQPGTPLRIRGRVLNTAGQPLRGALLDVWHASDDGHYDNEDEEHTHVDAEFQYRGRMQSDASGVYAYETILPGAYLIEEGVSRPRHVHYRVSYPGYETLTTQLYFAGDPDLAHDEFALPSLVIGLEPDSDGLAGVFDIVLANTL